MYEVFEKVYDSNIFDYWFIVVFTGTKEECEDYVSNYSGIFSIEQIMKYVLIIVLLLNSCVVTTQPNISDEIKEFNDRGVLIYKDTKSNEYFYNSYGKLILKHNKLNGKRYIYKDGKVVKVVK